MRTQHPRAHRALVAIAAATALGLAACSDADDVADLDLDPAAGVTTVATAATPATAAPPSTTGAAAEVSTTVTTTGVPSTGTPAETSVDTTGATPGTDAGIDGPTFSDALGTRVDSAPGVATRGDTRRLLDEGLWIHIAWEPDPNDPSVFTVQPDDVEILEAYANAATAFYSAAMTTRTTDAAAFDEFFVDGGAKFDAAFDQAVAGNYVKILGEGVLLRPYVLADNRSEDEAVVLDCAVSHELWIQVGESQPSSAGVPALLGTVATMQRVGGAWLVATVADESSACL